MSIQPQQDFVPELLLSVAASFSYIDRGKVIRSTTSEIDTSVSTRRRHLQRPISTSMTSGLQIARNPAHSPKRSCVNITKETLQPNQPVAAETKPSFSSSVVDTRLCRGVTNFATWALEVYVEETMADERRDWAEIFEGQSVAVIESVWMIANA